MFWPVLLGLVSPHCASTCLRRREPAAPQKRLWWTAKTTKLVRSLTGANTSLFQRSAPALPAHGVRPGVKACSRVRMAGRVGLLVAHNGRVPERSA